MFWNFRKCSYFGKNGGKGVFLQPESTPWWVNFPGNELTSFVHFGIVFFIMLFWKCLQFSYFNAVHLDCYRFLFQNFLKGKS